MLQVLHTPMPKLPGSGPKFNFQRSVDSSEYDAGL